MRILLTNDDSHSSLLLLFIIEKLKAHFKDVTIVVPKEQQSGRAKAITCFNLVEQGEEQIFGHSVTTIMGTPADCVNVGIYHLCDGPPDLVVSGINSGINAGVSFVMSSGTVGACFEANLAGCPALALSQAYDHERWYQYSRNNIPPEEDLKRLRAQTLWILDRVFDVIEQNRELVAVPITWNINIPFWVTAQTEYRVCPLGLSSYQSFFRRTSEGYEPVLSSKFYDTVPGTDEVLIHDGHITITPLDVRGFGRQSDYDLSRLGDLFASSIGQYVGQTFS